MTTNRRIYWAMKAVGIAPLGEPSPTLVYGLQSIGLNTTFNLEQVFTMGQLAIYENIEEIPDVEITMEKVIDGYPLIYHLLTRGASTGTLSGRSGARGTVVMSIFGDLHDSASGTPHSEVECSGTYLSAVSYTMPVEGNCTESVTVVGNDKTWRSAGFSQTGTLFDNTDTPLALQAPGSGGVQRRENVVFGTGAIVAVDANGQANATTAAKATILPSEVAGISSSGTNEPDANGDFPCSIQNISISADLGREALNELGHKKPYFRFVNFPVEVSTDIEIIAKTGDFINVSDSTSLSSYTIKVALEEGTFIDLGTNNKLSNITMGGGDAGGGNDTITYSYTTFNDFTVSHPQDPSGL